MEKTIKIKDHYTSLDKIKEFINTESPFEASKEYDHWELRTDAKGQMEQCVIVKKSNMHGAKVYLTGADTLKLDYIIPNKVMNAYFGKSQKARKNILEIAAGAIKSTILAGPQKKAFEEIVQTLNKIEA